MKQVLIKHGQAVVEDVPAPVVADGEVLVRTDYSCISAGTEMSGVKESGAPLWRRALAQPEKVKKVVEMVASEGLARTKSLVQGRLSAGTPTGYSLAGTVMALGEGVADLAVGDRVACAGAQAAHHAEIVSVPRNLVVPVPDGLDLSIASTVTLGAIALQGVRRASPTLGENFVVLGLGILGQLTAQLLKANGCRVIGTDLDRTRIDMALELGMDAGLHPDDGDDIAQIARLTGGIGADGVIITAATPSDAVVSTAFKMCRKKGRVVLVGDVGLHLNRADFYQKELDFFISSSYGPGRYDRKYEEEGLDYPVGYVRWTENRNMSEYLRLVAESRVKVEPLVSNVFLIDEAPQAYEALKTETDRPLMVLLTYPLRPEADEQRKTVVNPHARASSSDKVRFALIGAGGFAKGMHLPNLGALRDMVSLRAVISHSGPNALATAAQFGAEYSGTDMLDALDDPDIDAVLIATRHNLHARQALAALKAGKHVLVEKPLALYEEELSAIEEYYATQDGEKPVLLVGFNRRFSPYARRIKEIVAGRTAPMILNYRMNAGYIPLDHWVHGKEGGGRNIGEACHIYDLFTYLTDSRIATVEARAINPTTAYCGRNDNFVATLSFEDGSVATLTYTALGSSEYPKEHLDVFVDGKVLVMTDYRRLQIHGASYSGMDSKVSDKGHLEELKTLANCIRYGGEWPIPLWQIMQATRIALDVESHISGLDGPA